MDPRMSPAFINSARMPSSSTIAALLYIYSQAKNEVGDVSFFSHLLFKLIPIDEYWKY